ncbi:MAG: hypothetical protein QG635_1953 [Bacteroidota bacterium]|nr:hypothetical protein [Bacteroidota bacterium]
MSSTGSIKSQESYIYRLIDCYRDSLIALIPIFDRLGIKWIDDEQFDDFEGISEALYKWEVLFNLENIGSTNHGFVPELPNYGIIYNDYSKLSYIEVVAEGNFENNQLVFVAFRSIEKSFDTIICSKISENGKILEKDIPKSFDDVEFRFRLRQKDGAQVTYK